MVKCGLYNYLKKYLMKSEKNLLYYPPLQKFFVNTYLADAPRL